MTTTEMRQLAVDWTQIEQAKNEAELEWLNNGIKRDFANHDVARVALEIADEYDIEELMGLHEELDNNLFADPAKLQQLIAILESHPSPLEQQLAKLNSMLATAA